MELYFLLESDLLSFGLIDDNDYLTNAGALFADENLIYQSRIFATRWNGIDKVNGRLEALDDKEFNGKKRKWTKKDYRFLHDARKIYR